MSTLLLVLGLSANSWAVDGQYMPLYENLISGKHISKSTLSYETFVKDQLTDTKVLVLIRRSDETGMLQVQARRHCHQERVHRYF